MNRKELRELAKKIVDEYANNIKTHLEKERAETIREMARGEVGSVESFKEGFERVVSEYLQKHNIKLSFFEKEDLALLVAFESLSRRL
ncbi:MAG: hypothetical protein DRN30_04605 [Thermoplasmata archaeon]|nr:MAG: hypothetical protein DRN30_04605 [Thermoplasmata archaeon]